MTRAEVGADRGEHWGERNRPGPAVVIVGSGPAGVSAAWPLVEAGVEVLMLDASREEPHPSPPRGDIGSFRRHPARWREQFGRDLAGLGLDQGGDHSPKLATPLARSVLAQFATASGLATDDFLALGSLGRGGLSNIWGALAAVYDDGDLAGFPIRQADLLPSYRAVMARIGVSGAAGADGLPVEEGPQLTEPARRLLGAYARRRAADNLRIARTTNAILMTARDGREGCERCGLCLWGCSRNSIYNSAFELDQLQRRPNFTYQPASFIAELLPAGAGHRLVVERAGRREIVSAPRIVLAAGTIATTSLVLRRLGLQGTPVRLLNNPVAAIAFVLPPLVGAPLPDRSFSLAQLSYQLPLADGGIATGAFYGADTLPLSEIAGRLPLSRPVALRVSRALAPALLLATIYLPGRFSQNTLRVEEAGGRPALAIEGTRPEETRGTLIASGKRLARAMRRLGAYAVPRSFSLSQPGADAHYAGTLPMGRDGLLGCSLQGEVNGVPGLYVVDGANLPDLPAKHCTLTIMANADRIARQLVHALASRGAPEATAAGLDHGAEERR